MNLGLQIVKELEDCQKAVSEARVCPGVWRLCQSCLQPLCQEPSSHSNSRPPPLYTLTRPTFDSRICPVLRSSVTPTLKESLVELMIFEISYMNIDVYVP